MALASGPAFVMPIWSKQSRRAEGTMHEPPSEVRCGNEKLEPAFCSVIVRDAAGKQIDQGDGKVDTSDRMSSEFRSPKT